MLNATVTGVYGLALAGALVMAAEGRWIVAALLALVVALCVLGVTLRHREERRQRELVDMLDRQYRRGK